jgi:Fe2+ or Zn2+ uptake regulation protein
MSSFRERILDALEDSYDGLTLEQLLDELDVLEGSPKVKTVRIALMQLDKKGKIYPDRVDVHGARWLPTPPLPGGGAG